MGLAPGHRTRAVRRHVGRRRVRAGSRVRRCSQAAWTERLDGNREAQRDQRLGGGDVGCRPLSADELFSRLQGEHIAGARLAVAIVGSVQLVGPADDATRHLTHVGETGCEQPQRGSAERRRSGRSRPSPVTMSAPASPGALSIPSANGSETATMSAPQSCATFASGSRSTIVPRKSGCWTTRHACSSLTASAETIESTRKPAPRA